VAATAATQPAVDATMGPATTRLGRTILVATVAGLDRLAGAVVAATSDLGAPPEGRPFLGHVTLARAKHRLPSTVVGAPIDASWTVTELAVVASDTRPEGARYTDVARISLGRSGPQ
jgi:2'-5' RNA ligase